MLLYHLSLDCAGTCTWYRGVATGHRVASTHDPFHTFSCMARLLEIWSLQKGACIMEPYTLPYIT